jgi:hypothetical protein
MKKQEIEKIVKNCKLAELKGYYTSDFRLVRKARKYGFSTMFEKNKFIIFKKNT